MFISWVRVWNMRIWAFNSVPKQFFLEVTSGIHCTIDAPGSSAARCMCLHVFTGVGAFSIVFHTEGSGWWEHSRAWSPELSEEGSHTGKEEGLEVGGQSDGPFESSFHIYAFCLRIVFTCLSSFRL